MKSDDKDAIETKTQAIAQAAHKLAEQIYKEEQAKQQAQQQQQPAGEKAAAEGGAAKDDGNVVDAEYTEVKDKK
jgi:molecular chaperone DnaK